MTNILPGFHILHCIHSHTVTGTLGFIWMSQRGPYILTGSLTEGSYLKSSHVARLGYN